MNQEINNEEIYDQEINDDEMNEDEEIYENEEIYEEMNEDDEDDEEIYEEMNEDGEEMNEDGEEMNEDEELIIKKNEFIGSINIKPGWIKCLYCNIYHPLIMHLPGITYCGHCWGWLNSNQLDLEKNIYMGNNSITDVKKFLKETFKIHDNKKCISKECIYNKIIDLNKINKLHNEFCVELGFIKKNDKIDNIISNNQEIPLIISDYKINQKSNLKINFKLSNISI
jgi:hypothetical protein